MAYETLQLERDGAVATITLNRPKQFNAFNTTLRAELLQAVEDVNADDAIRVVVLKGAGRGFSAGADLTDELPDPISQQIDTEYKPVLSRIFDGPKIYIAQVHGTAAGIGAALAMSCDLMVMEENASIYMAFAAIALIPDGGNTWLLLQQMGYRRALAAILEGKHIPAPDCLDLGLTNKTADAEGLDEAVANWARAIAAKAPMANAAAKRLLRSVGTVSFQDAISQEGQEQNPLIRSNDFRRGVEAFFAKEKPEFLGN